jgi:hypothetical protein
MITTWNIIPDYDEWGIDSSWSCSDWIQWHKELKKKFGTDRAKYIWEYAYTQGTLGASHWDCRTFNTEFRNYVAKNDLNAYNSTPLSAILRPIGVGTDILDGVFGGLESVGRNTKTILMVALFGATAYFGYKIYKTYE